MAGHDVLSVILAIAFGGVIGLERQTSGKPAGLRTNVLICFGAAIFTIVSEKMAAGQSDSITRIAAQIVTGVGFIGAGAIIRDRAGVHGLTTAATIWLVASIGMACGAGLYLLALVSTILAVGVLFGFKIFEKFVTNRNEPSSPLGNVLKDSKDKGEILP
jgi:putative Mg2+ transporter-C (MgtC) family protein